MKKLILLLILVLIPLAAAEQLHEGWHHSGDEWEVSGDTYSVLHEYGESNVFIESPEKSFILSEGECKETPTREVCLQALEQNLSSDHVKYEDGEIVAGIKVKISSIGPEISLTRNIDKKELDLEERATVTVIIKNTGNKPIDSYRYTDEYPDAIEVVEAGSGTNAFTRKGSVGAGKEASFEYHLEAQDYITYESQANLSFSYLDLTEAVTSQTHTIKIIPPYEIAAQVSNAAVKAGETIQYNFTVKNNKVEEVHFKNVEITHTGLESASEDVTTEENKAEWEGFLEEGEEETLTINLTTKTEGKYQITLKAEVDVLGTIHNEEIIKEVSVSVPEVDVEEEPEPTEEEPETETAEETDDETEEETAEPAQEQEDMIEEDKEQQEEDEFFVISFLKGVGDFFGWLFS